MRGAWMVPLMVPEGAGECLEGAWGSGIRSGVTD